VVLVRERRAENRHDAVAHHLVHRALVPVNRIHHRFEHRIEQLAGVLWVPIREQLHGALHVGEQTVTCLRSPSRALRDVRIFSARWRGV